MALQNFLQGFLALTRGTEIPEPFALWAGLSSVGSVLGRKCFLDRGTYTLYPNLFIVFVAGSGKCRKSTTVNLAAKLVARLDPGPHVTAQKTTPEALIEALHSGENGKPRETCEGWCFVDELSNFINRTSYDQGLGQVLISLYDCLPSFKYHTRGRGIEEVKRAFFGLLSGTTGEELRNAIPEAAIGGGLTSRMIFVYVKETPPPVAFPEFGPEKKALQELLIKQLQLLFNRAGQFSFSSSGRITFSRLYSSLYDSPLYDSPLTSGYASRRGDHTLKLAMLLSAVDNGSFLLESRHIETADWILTQTESKLDDILNTITTSGKGGITQDVLSAVENSGGLTRSELMRKFSHKVSASELSELITTLIQSNQIDAQPIGKTIIYHPHRTSTPPHSKLRSQIDKHPSDTVYKLDQVLDNFSEPENLPREE